MFVVVCYDIVENRRRNRILRKLKDYLAHVQKSVFEGQLEEDRLGPMRKMLLDEIDPLQDTVRIYHQCGRCQPATEVLGVGLYVANDDSDQVI